VCVTLRDTDSSGVSPSLRTASVAAELSHHTIGIVALNHGVKAMAHQTVALQMMWMFLEKNK